MRRSLQHIVLTLWPFLDILSCLAGALTVIIAALLVTEMVDDPAATRPINTKLAQTQREIEAKRAEIARYKIYIQEQEQLHASLKQAREDDALLQQRLEERSHRQGFLVSLLQQKTDVLEQIEDLRQKQARQEAEIRRLRAANQGTVTPDATDRIEVHFVGRGRDLKPVFVECTADGIVIHAGKDTSFVRDRNIAVSDAYRRTLKQIQSTLGGTITFLIRPSGVEAFELAEQVANQAGVRNGQLPIPGEGAIDLGTYAGPSAMRRPTEN